MEELVYTPSEWGKIFHSLKTNEALGAGSAGPGKSMVLLFDPMEQVLLEHQRCNDKNHPYHIPWGMSTGHALHLRREAHMLGQTIDRSLKYFSRMDPGATYNKSERMWTFSSGYKFQFGHCKDPGDWEQYLSNQYTHIAYDELTQFEEEQYHQINARLRSSDPLLQHMLKIRAMSNPFCKKEGETTVKDPHWVRRRFVDPAPNGKVILKKRVTLRSGEEVIRTRIYLPATLYDNPDPIFVRSYEIELQDKPAHIRQAMLYGDWYINPDSFYGSEWDRTIHVCKPFKIPSDWPRLRAMDWGFKKPGVVGWGAIDPDGTLYVYKEFTFSGMKPSQVAKVIEREEKKEGIWAGDQSGIPGVADTQLWEQRGESGPSKALEFAENGVPWMRADKKSRQRNAERLLTRLKDHRKYTARPGIVFFETCEKCITTIPVIPTNPDNSEEPLDGGDDHWHDMVCYMVAAADIPGFGESKDQIKEHETRYEDEDEYDPEISIDG